MTACARFQVIFENWAGGGAAPTWAWSAASATPVIDWQIAPRSFPITNG